MSIIQEPFRISTGLKDLIGRDLVTDEFVAVFELVKNAFDAHATNVQIRFEQDRIVIADDGKGMSHSDILNKWLFIAYSAKREGTEDDDYRDHIRGPRRPFAGAKGVGRFSCDRLGRQLLLYSQSKGHPIQVLEIDWTQYENDSKQEFDTVEATISQVQDFPLSLPKTDGKSGTVLLITNLRSIWGREKLQKLKRELMKLISPFSDTSPDFEIELIAPDQKDSDEKDAKYNVHLPQSKDKRLIVNGKIDNLIVEVLSKRTTVIKVSIVNNGDTIESILEDRGEIVYHISESNPYFGLKSSGLVADIYYLNRSAKTVFARRMGLPSVQFGSIFLFRNGFRVFPVGHQVDDFFGLARRKQQGVRRFLGSRDLIGRVEVKGVSGFDEATSRDQGLIRTPEVTELINCIISKCVRRLERYVVDITWKDRFDKDIADTSRMRRDESSAKIAELVSRLSDTDGLVLVKYNPDLVRIIDDKAEAFESSLNALALLAERTGDDELLARVAKANANVRELQAAEVAAREAARRAKERAVDAEKKYVDELQRNRFLVAASSLDHDTILNLHHQILMHASDVHIGVRRMMGRLRRNTSLDKDDWIDFLESVSFRNSQILTASRFATKGGYKQQSVEIREDLAIYIRDYITTISSLWAPRGLTVVVHNDGKTLTRPFRPIEVGIVIDNLISNSVKARASRIELVLEIANAPRPELAITVADDGRGWPASLERLERALEKGITTTDGSGLGLYHVKQVIEGLGGIVEVSRSPYSDSLNGAQLTLRVPG